MGRPVMLHTWIRRLGRVWGVTYYLVIYLGLKYASNNGRVVTSTSGVVILNLEASRAKNKDEEDEMSALCDDKVYNEGFYEEWEIKDNQILLMMELQQTPLDEVMHDVRNFDREDPFIVINHPKLD
ncbi:hypothetical protein PVK06_017536 [Gossypium arboreum]|uniref:Uncharacterized protein n=1 Tax=Gossypium arboreum TaxID=29729 RepID=A0ABR0Q2Z5_GOSAR|nr:hypothetical protein PVK06_017536 [Gossypium arboreum]